MDNVVDWPALLGDQLSFHWTRQARPRLDGLTDWEYLGEPAAGCWSLRPRLDRGSGLAMDHNNADAEPPPFTTIAWRLAHVTRHILGARTYRTFGGADPDQVPFPATADEALGQLDDAYRRWQAGLSAMSSGRLTELSGREEPYFEGQPLATLVLHVNREVLCHCAEVALLRDLYARVRPATPDYWSL